MPSFWEELERRNRDKGNFWDRINSRREQGSKARQMIDQQYGLAPRDSLSGNMPALMMRALVEGRWRTPGTLTPGFNFQQERQLRGMGAAGSGLASSVSGGNGVQDILEELKRLQDPSRYDVDPALLERQAMSAAAAQYDPLIAALRGQMGAAQSRAQTNRGQLEGMYSGLSQNLMNEVAPMQQRFQETQQNVAQQYQGLENQINEQYADSQAQQEAMLQRLNIEAAAPAALEDQFRDRDAAVVATQKEAQNVASQLTQQGQGAVNYTQQGAQMARTEGTNRVADLMANLEQYLAEATGQVAGHQAAKANAYQGNLAQLMQGSQRDSVDRAQRDFENYITMLKLGRELEGGGQQVGPTKNPIDVGPRAMALGLDVGGAQKLQNVFMTAMSDPMVMASVDPNSGMALSKFALANRVVEVGRGQGLSGPELNALQNIALEYFNR